MGKTVVITSPQTVTTAISWPADRELKFEKGGYILFSGSGALTGLKESRPEYFGANTVPGTTDMTVAVQKALNASLNVVFSNPYGVSEVSTTLEDQKLVFNNLSYIVGIATGATPA
ncbi:MAG: hypothetical protein J0653_00695, partial [Deltaproteobacteria bacterium]|nr:hypothetical protein [Deltaproteobacteria bacterium]